MKSYDVVIVGGGPAGLSAALIFGRARRVTLLVDGDVRRNARAAELHNFVTRDGIAPEEFRAIARSQLTPYTTVEVRDAKVSRIERSADGFYIFTADDAAKVRARRVLLATGVRDEPPAIEGLSEHWGHGSFQCPYCHGWELRDRPWGMLVPSEAHADRSPLLLCWTDRLTAFTNGVELAADAVQRMVSAGITVEQAPIARLLGGKGRLESIALTSGRIVPCEALVVHPRQRPADLVVALALELEETGFVRVNPMTKESSIPGLHVAGDATTMMQTAIMAAAEGTMAAAMINHALVADGIARAAR